MAPVVQLVGTPLDAAALERAVADPGCGCTILFVGTTRDTFEGRRVVRLEYEAYAAMAVPVLRELADEAASRWTGVRVALAHRIGVVPVGEASVVIAVAAPHREAGYEASRFLIDALKARAPIWKKEIYDDGSAWKANPPGEPG
jgi:molybdopterin synthase catalytic subunit